MWYILGSVAGGAGVVVGAFVNGLMDRFVFILRVDPLYAEAAHAGPRGSTRMSRQSLSDEGFGPALALINHS